MQIRKSSLPVKKIFRIIRVLKNWLFYIDYFFYKILEDSSSVVFYIYNLFSFTTIIVSSALILLEILHDMPPSIKPYAERLVDLATFVIVFEWIGRFILTSSFLDDFEKAYFKYRTFFKAFKRAFKPKWEYVKSFYSIIDILSILYLFQPLRLLRILALLRIFRLGFYRFILEGFVVTFKESFTQLVFLAIVFAVFLFFMSFVIFSVEHKANPSIKNFFDAIYFTFISLTTVGYGDITPATEKGKAIIMLTVAGGVGLFSLFTAILSSGFIEYIEKIRKGMVEFKNLKRHIVICGWNETGTYIIKEIRENPRLFKKPIVVLTEMEDITIPKGCFVKKGDPTKEEYLISVNIEEAELVVVLAEKKPMLDEDTIDARTSLIVLLVRSLVKDAFIIAEFLKEENARAAQKRKLANKIIISGEYLGKLIGKSVINPKSLSIFEELLEGLHLDVIPFKEYSDKPMTLEDFLKEVGYLKVLGVFKGKRLILKPPLNLEIAPEDELIILN